MKALDTGKTVEEAVEDTVLVLTLIKILLG